MLAELIDAVVGVDTHRDTHEVEIALPTGTPIATCSISNDSTGYAELLAWIVDHAPRTRRQQAAPHPRFRAAAHACRAGQVEQRLDRQEWVAGALTLDEGSKTGMRRPAENPFDHPRDRLAGTVLAESVSATASREPSGRHAARGRAAAASARSASSRG
jgi:hypothetical protein